MIDPTERLLALRVSDVMAKQVVLVSVHQTMAEAARIFSDNDVSAAPVVDEQGRCVGILSAADFVVRERKTDADDDALAGQPHELVDSGDQAAIEIVAGTEDAVARYMTQAVQTVDAGASLIAAARIMYAQHVHRLPAIDPDGRPIGMLSTMDMVAALVNSIDEMKSSLGHS